MKKRKIIFFDNDKYVAKHSAKELSDFFEDYIEIDSYITTELTDDMKIEGDLVVTITPIDIAQIKRFLKEETDIIQGTRTILQEKYDELKRLPMGTTALVVNVNKNAAFGLTSFLVDVGLDQIEYFPVYSGCKNIPETDVVIIAGDLNFDIDIDIDFNKTINLDYRRITVETYKTIMMLIDINNEKLEKKLEDYYSKLAPIKYTVVPILKIHKTEKILNTTINEIDYGILIINDNNKIVYVNDALLGMLKISKNNVIYQYLSDNILPIKIYEELMNTHNVDFKILNIEGVGKRFILSKKGIDLDENSVGSIITLKDVTNIEKLEMQLRGVIFEKGYISKYTFEDIIGTSDVIKKCKERAKKIALIDKTVLVLGESGTGKEMFVQAIHNYSNRNNMPFVAVNCASLPTDLLESELFGYAEGSFTGAKKGGKKGLFELAHRGTIFLDEIGDVPLEVQVKLLRVLQEKEIRRIGADNVIPVDVRVIAATNRNLEQMVHEKQFRMDLYYRLNAFTLIIPPIRERKEDIPLIIHSILNELGFSNKKIDNSLKEIIYKYKWTGNIRELRNCIEYMSYMGQEILNINDLPPTFSIEANNSGIYTNNLLNGFTNEETDIIIFLLKNIKGRNLGRTALYELCKDNEIIISEYKLRKFLNYLSENQYIQYGGGRKGAVITDKGLMLVEKHTYCRLK